MLQARYIILLYQARIHVYELTTRMYIMSAWYLLSIPPYHVLASLFLYRS